jgi:methyl-accepting chemotaxis protein
MDKLKTGQRLAVAFGLLIALMLLAAGLALLGLRNAESQASRLASDNVALLNAVSAMRVAQLNEAIAIRDFVGQVQVEAQQAANRALSASDRAFNEAAETLDRIAANDEDRAGLAGEAARLKEASILVQAKLREAISQAEMAEYAQAQAVVYNDLRPLQSAIASNLEALAARTSQVARDRATEARAQARRIELMLLGVLALSLAIGVAATVRITRAIVRPLGSAVTIAERVAEGDLTEVRAEAAGTDETGRVLTALGRMREGLHQLVAGIRQSADGVAQVAGQVSDANADLAARTEEQAASLEETAASMEELTATVRQNTENANQASQLARDAARLAEEGGQAVLGVVGTMGGIEQSARRVADIVGMMDGIAFQTNLLALNAAVEAARAGEHGRGFGVVAAQIRELAQRSAQAAREIKQLVDDAVGEVAKGTKAAGRAGDTMGNAVRAAQDAARVVADIARAGEEQRGGIEQVNGTVAQLEGVTQSNARLVQQITALAEGLLEEAAVLQDAAGRFRLDEAGAASPGSMDLHAAEELDSQYGDEYEEYEEDDEPAGLPHSGWQTLPAPLR